MTDLLSELMHARYRAAGDAMDEAVKHITEALELLDDARAAAWPEAVSPCGPRLAY